jgi:hypothetical protein
MMGGIPTDRFGRVVVQSAGRGGDTRPVRRGRVRLRLGARGQSARRNSVLDIVVFGRAASTI